MKSIARIAVFTLSAFWAVQSHAAEPDKKTAIVLVSGEASVCLIDMASRSVYQTFYVGKEPHHLLLTPDQKAVLVANAAGNDIVFLDPKTGEMIRRVPNIIDPYRIGYSPDKKWFVAAGNRLDRIDIYTADDQDLKLVKVIKAPKTLSHIAFTNDSKTAFVTLQDSDETTTRGDFSLDDSWSDFWKDLQKDGHAFGNHTYYHTYYIKDLAAQRVQVKSQFGPRAGQLQDYSQQDLCADLGQVDRQFRKMTGRSLDPIWRAPGGKTNDRYTRMGHACGYSHVGWSQAGFLGDELSSEKYPNEQLLQKALKAIKPGDSLMAHCGSGRVSLSPRVPRLERVVATACPAPQPKTYDGVDG